MTMYRDKAPGEGDEPPLTTNAPDDARGYNKQGWNVIGGVVITIAVLMVLAGLMWGAQIVSIFSAVAGR